MSFAGTASAQYGQKSWQPVYPTAAYAPAASADPTDPKAYFCAGTSTSGYNSGFGSYGSFRTVNPFPNMCAAAQQIIPLLTSDGVATLVELIKSANAGGLAGTNRLKGAFNYFPTLWNGISGAAGWLNSPDAFRATSLSSMKSLISSGYASVNSVTTAFLTPSLDQYIAPLLSLIPKDRQAGVLTWLAEMPSQTRQVFLPLVPRATEQLAYFLTQLNGSGPKAFTNLLGGYGGSSYQMQELFTLLQTITPEATAKFGALLSDPALATKGGLNYLPSFYFGKMLISNKLTVGDMHSVAQLFATVEPFNLGAFFKSPGWVNPPKYGDNLAFFIKTVASGTGQSLFGELVNVGWYTSWTHGIGLVGFILSAHNLSDTGIENFLTLLGKNPAIFQPWRSTWSRPVDNFGSFRHYLFDEGNAFALAAALNSGDATAISREFEKVPSE